MTNNDKNYLDILRKIKIFDGCDDETFLNILKHSRLKRYSDKETILEQNKKIRYIYFILAGNVFIKYHSHLGKEIFLRLHGPGDVIGIISTFDGQPASGSFIASGHVVVAALSQKVFREICANDSHIAYALLNTIATRSRSLISRFVEHNALGAANRVHAELLRMGRANLVSTNSAEVKPYLTHSEIAFRVTTQREVVAREFNYLKRQNIIRTTRSCLYIDDMKRLEEIVKNITGNERNIAN